MTEENFEKEKAMEVGDVCTVMVEPDDNNGRMGRVMTVKGDFFGLKFAKKENKQESETIWNYKFDQIKFHSKDARKENK